ncbi:MAG: YggT family protein [Chloroflexota bacterium]|nr:YggT family protein [Chloroflexota bacterium]
MIVFLITLVDIIVRLFVLLLLVHVVLSYFMSPFHPIRQRISRIIEPLLAPIRRVLPTMGRFDFSPLVLLILVQIAGMILTSLLRSLL